MPAPSLSIIVPVFNVERYLHECVNAILAQRFTEFEVILIDDGSPDGCPEICDAYAKQDPRVQVIHQANEGPQSACIRGLRMSRGKYIGFVDSDDWIDPGMYADMMAEIELSHADIVQCGLRCVGSTSSSDLGTPKETRVFDKDAVRRDLAPRLLTFYQYEDPLVRPARGNKVFRRDLLVRNTGYCDTGIRFGEDMNIVLPALLDASTVICLPRCYYNYRANESSITRSPKPGLWSQNRLLFAAIDKVCADKSLDLQPYAHGYFNYMVLITIINYGVTPQSYAESISGIRAVLRENPARGSLPQLAVSSMGWTPRAVHLLLRLHLIPLVPPFLRIARTLRNYKGKVGVFARSIRRTRP